ncbi:acetylornithine deacetylase [Nereida ignava]|uniref:Acetylornithine deacetylase n=1 Tax=Nereida ignava TaxID=282199 RepID=A0A0U1NHZ9_9RHOB|nr:acetylornithine deacetylase [Nereida ignava]CRK74360.1 Acetylornithine deacetylase [Nereida ignava]SFJ46676.1 acetylornithine deacetylase [Nereida ignava DSM 16309]
MASLKETTELLGKLISFPSVSSDSNLDLINFLAEYLERTGARVITQPSADGIKANLWATLGPEGPGGIVLSGHSDVVPVTDQDWTSDPFEMVERDGKLFGRGTCDMKGFIAAAAVKAADYAAKPLKRPVHFSFTYDEETACLGIQDLAKWLTEQDLRPALAIVGEPTMMQVIEGHKGCNEYTTHFHGCAGHGSMPDLGVNAVEYAVRYVSRLLDIGEQLKTRAPADSRFEPPWTTINTGALVGGTAHNVIPETASVDWEFRPVQMSDFHFVKEEIEDYAQSVLLPAMRAVDPDANIRTEIIGEVAGLEPATVNEARDILLELTGSNGAGVVPFGTEAGIFGSLGMSAVVCGPGSIEQAHKPDEFLALDQLQKCLTMLDDLERKVHA